MAYSPKMLFITCQKQITAPILRGYSCLKMTTLNENQEDKTAEWPNIVLEECCKIQKLPTLYFFKKRKETFQGYVG